MYIIYSIYTFDITVSLYAKKHLILISTTIHLLFVVYNPSPRVYIYRCNTHIYIGVVWTFSHVHIGTIYICPVKEV